MGNGIVEGPLSWPVEKWCRPYFRTSVKCDVMDNKMAEAFNEWILEQRHKSILSMLEEIRIMVMRRIARKRSELAKWPINLSYAVMKKLDKANENSCD